MSNVCEITGKRRLKGHRVSHANNKTIHFQQPNIQEKRLFIPELGVRFSIKVTTKGLRTIDKHGGLSRYLLKQKPDELTPRLKKLRKILVARGVH